MIDEAHQLEDVATQYFGVRGQQLPGRRARARRRPRHGGGQRRPTTTASSAAPMTRVDDRAAAFFGALALGAGHAGAPRPAPAAARRPRPRRRRDARARAGDRARGCSTRSTALEAPVALVDASAPEDLRAIGAARGRAPRRPALPARGERPRLRLLPRDARAAACSCAPRPSTCRRSSATCCSTASRPTVLTSATLTVDGIVRATCAAASASSAASEIRLPSEFDFAPQAMLYLPTRMPSPKTPAFAAGRRPRGRRDPAAHRRARLRAVHELRDAARGAGRRRRRRSTTRFSCRAPRRGRRCSQQFRSTPHAVLLATSSFWQGVDVVGEALSCVIIDRLPFASPGDPVIAARIEAIARAGRRRRSPTSRCRWPS